jgi:hypothetical protein
MPGPAIRIGRRVGDGGQRSVQILSVLDRRGAVGRADAAAYMARDGS